MRRAPAGLLALAALLLAGLCCQAVAECDAETGKHSCTQQASAAPAVAACRRCLLLLLPLPSSEHLVKYRLQEHARRMKWCNYRSAP